MSDQSMVFKASAAMTVGVELELQVLNTRDHNLARDAADLIDLLEKTDLPGTVKPEITESMLELNTSIHAGYPALLKELVILRNAIAAVADKLNLAVAGGGSHPYQEWSERRIYPTERFKHLLETYGYLAKQFTVFGQHVHIGCPDGDAALYLMHVLARYVPHFVALSASSPFQQGADTSYQSSRLNTISAFPLSGQAPFVQTWADFTAYFEKMRGYGIVQSMKDFYWDIRPKPEYGTVEIRVFDTPLTVQRAAEVAAYAQSLARYLLAERPHPPSADVYVLYNYNRFQACRYGLMGTIIDAHTGRHVEVRQDILQMLKLIGHTSAGENEAALDKVEDLVRTGRTDAQWLRERYAEWGSLHDVVREQAQLWMCAGE